MPYQKSRSPSCGKDCSTASPRSSSLTSCIMSVLGFWMSDKPRVQQDLAQELAELLLTITSIPSSLSFLEGFWITTVREWNGIDRLRYVPHASPSCSPLNLLQEWTSIICSSGVFSMPPSGSSYELNGTPQLFRNIPPYLQIQVVRSGKFSFLNLLPIDLDLSPAPPMYACQLALPSTWEKCT